jgi:Cdc6-like AAA superfamily ATPase
MMQGAMAVSMRSVDLLERDHELAALDQALAEVRDDSAGRILLVSGDAGAGKTTLLRRAIQWRRTCIPPVSLVRVRAPYD